MLEELVEIRPYEALKRTRDAMSSRLLLLRLQRLHYEHAPKEYKDNFLPVLYRPSGIKITPRRPVIEPPRNPVLITPIAPPNLDYLEIPETTPLRTILLTVAHYYRKRPFDILGKRRTKDLITPRHVCLYLASRFSDASYSMIGNFFRRDHTVVFYAKTTIAEKIGIDPVLALQVKTISKQLASLEHMPKIDHVKRLREKAAAHFRRYESPSDYQATVKPAREDFSS